MADEVKSAYAEEYEAAVALIKISPEKSMATFHRFVFDVDVTDEEFLRYKELSVLKLGELYRDHKDAEGISKLIRSTKGFLLSVSKAKTTKIVRSLIDLLSDLPSARTLQIQLCQECIDWASDEKRVYLKRSLETRLIALYLDNKQYTDALKLISSLLTELKRLDDKMLLIEVQLLESRVCLEIRNVPKARAALTSARTSANAIYCPPLLQAALDNQSGILHAEEKDFKTAYSYFYEALEGFSSQDDPNAVYALKYMLLCKVMLHNAEDVNAIVMNKTALRYAGPEVEAMRAIAKAAQHRSLKEFEAALGAHPHALNEDLIVKSHLHDLYDTLLEDNLSKIVEPFSIVEISHIAELIELPVKTVEAKISQMILDKKFHGVLDQGAGCLVVFDEPSEDKTYQASLQTVASVSKVVDSLFQRATKLT